jgi:hypothetical protein
MKHLIVLSVWIILATGCYDCYDHANEFKKVNFQIILKKKFIKQYKVTCFEGVDFEGKRAFFEDVGFNDVYEIVQIGDTLIKVSGSADIKICKKDTCIINHRYCGEKIIQ